MIYATVNMTVGDYESTCDQKIVLYRGDKNVEIRFVIKANRFTVLDSTYAQLIITRPSSSSIFSEPAAIQNDTVVLVITEEMIDELNEIGEHAFQIRLYDNTMNARVTLPPCEGGIIIHEPIAIENAGEVGVATVGYALVREADTTEETFDENGDYNLTTWANGDLITESKMNKIEDAIYTVNSKVENVEIPDVSIYATTEYVNEEISTIELTPGPKGDKGDAGVDGKDGLTTSVKVNGSTYTHSNGTITLPNYPTVPTNVSAFTNDKNYLTSIPSEYVTESELNYVTPQMYGAKGDGSTDDTLALQSAFNAVAKSGKYLFIPKGRYKVTSPITIEWSYNSGTRRNFLQKIIGAGSTSYEKYYDNTVIVGYDIPAYRGVIELIGDGNTWGTQTRIEDLAIECDETSCDTMSFALMYGDARNFKLSRVKLRGHNGIYARCGSVVDTNGNSITRGYEQINIKFEQCDIYSFESSTRGFAFLPEGINTGSFAVMDNILVDSCLISGVWVVCSVNIMFQSCHTLIRNIENKLITTDNVGLLNGYEIDYGTGYYIGQAMSAVFQNCYFEDFRRGIQITPTLGNIRNVSIMNCYLNPGCNQFDSEGKRICADYGIRINQGASGKEVRNVLIQNNVFRLIEGDTEFNIANVSNEFANRFVFRDNCTTSTQVVPKVINTTATGYDICNDVTEGSSIKGMTSSDDGKELTIHLTNGLSYTVKGSTPVKGVDYFTEAELEEITENASDLAKAGLQQIEPPTWVEKVADMTDTSKHYVLQSSGNIWAYMEKTKTVAGSTVPNFTNLMDNSNSYVLNGQRYSHSSAAFKSQETDCAIVVPIPAASSYTFRVRGATMTGCSYPTSVYFGTTNQTFPNIPTNSGTVDLNYKNESNGDAVINVLKPPSGCSYAVFHVAKVTDTSALIVTVNEEITYTTTEATTTTVTEWTDTGRAFVVNLSGEDFATKSYVDDNEIITTFYGTSESLATDSEKIITVDDPKFTLRAGTIIAFKPSVSNSASNVKLNVNGTGAYPIWYSTSEYTSSSTAYTGYANRIIAYMFNGTHWVWIATSYVASTTNPSLGHGYGKCTTAEATLAKTCTISSYTLTTGGSVSIKFTNAVPANSTLNIRTRGAKKIFYKGAAITDGIIKAGDTATFVYDGTQYQLISIDKDYATKEYVDEAIESIDVTNQLTNYALKTELPTKTSQLTNDSGYLTSIPSEYVTDEELNAKNYVKTVNNLTPDPNGNVTVSMTTEPPTVVDSIEEMTDTSKQYVLSTDGFIYGYTKITQEEEWIDHLQEVGWNKGHRINSSGNIVAYNNSPVATTNYIPCKIGDVVKLEGMYIPGVYTNGAYHNLIAFYDENKTYLKQSYICDIADNSKELDMVIVDGNVIEFTLSNNVTPSNTAYILISAKTIDSDAQVLIKGIPKTKIPNFTNLADPTSSDWLTNTRLSTTATSVQEGSYVTNYIPCKKDDVIRILGMDIHVSSSQGSRIHTLDSDKQLVGPDTGYMTTLITNTDKATFENGLLTFYAGYSDAGGKFPSTAYIRYAGMLVDGYTVDEVIITVNEEITYTEEEVKEKWEWRSTGLSFVANDYSGVIAEMQTDISEIQTDIDNLEQQVSKLNTTSSGSSIPSYWVSELTTKADLIQQAVETAGRNKSAFLWYTDAHWHNNAKKSPMILEYMINNTSINKVNFGGDIITDHNPWVHDAVKYAYEWKQMISKIPNHHSVYGNHDVNHRTTDVSKIAYSLVLAKEESSDMVVGDIDSSYYIDCPSEKTRYIYKSYQTSDHISMMAECQFIADALKTTKEGWHIVAISHRWFQYTTSANPTAGNFPAYEKDILDVFDSYNARQIRAGSNYFTEQDFTNCKGKVEFCIAGHIHVDYDTKTTGGIPVIITASDTNQERSSVEEEDCGVVGTITENAVYGIIADYDNNKINVIGIGRGGSREVPLS